MKCVSNSENIKYSDPMEMFMDVYDKPTRNIEKQMKEFKDHINEYKDHYPLDKYEKL